MVNKKAVIITTIIAIIIFGAILLKAINDLNHNDSDKIHVSTTAKLSTENNIQENNLVQDDTAQNDVIENVTEENSTNTTNETNTTSENNEENQTVQENLEQLAISLVKEKWGNNNKDVYFSVEDEAEKGIYIVSVRDENTTAEITSYRVDINSKTVVED